MPYDQYGNYISDQQAGPSGGQIAMGALGGAASGAAAGSVALPGIGTAVGALVGAGYGLYSGLHQKSEARKMMQSNPYPTQPVPQGIQQNATQANRMALQGLPSAQYQEAMKNIQRQQAGAIIGAQSRRSGMDTIGSTNQSTNDAYQQLSAQDAAARRQNIQTAYGQNQALGQYQNQAFDWNQKARYQQNYSYSMALLGSGNQNLTRGIDMGAAGLTRLPNSAYQGLRSAIGGLFSGNTSSPLLPSSINTNYGQADANANALINNQ